MVRLGKTTKCYRDMNDSEDHLVDYVNCTAQQFRLIADYSLRGKIVDKFDGIIAELNKRVVTVRVVTLNNLYFPQWITAGFVSGYMVVGGMQVADPNNPDSAGMTLGMFLSDLSVFAQIGVCWGVIYQSLLEIMTVMPPLERVTTFMNLPTDVLTRGEMAEHNRHLTRDQRALLIGKGDDQRLPIDMLPIKIKDFKLVTSSFTMSYTGLLEAKQGNLIALVGNRGKGKATLLKLLSGVILPMTSTDPKFDPGVFMPSHLRVLHMSLDPMFVSGTLYENLCYGAKPGHPDTAMVRVVAILRDLSVNEDVIAKVASEDVMPWDTILSQTQKQAVCLARALIANPEVIGIHKPTQVFDSETALRTMKALRMFVINKGLHTNDETWHLRRVRTCVFTTASMMNVQMADQVFHVGQRGIREITGAKIHESEIT